MEILFFRGLPAPWEETERFVAHYEKTGWLDKNGQRITSRRAAARAWEPKPGKNQLRPALDSDFVEKWRMVYERAKLINPEAAGLLLSITRVVFHKAEQKIYVTIPAKQNSMLGKLADGNFLDEYVRACNDTFDHPIHVTTKTIDPYATRQ